METLTLTKDEKAALLQFLCDHMQDERDGYNAAKADHFADHILNPWKSHIEHLDTIKAKLHGFKK